MSTRGIRTQICNSTNGQTRRRIAGKFLELAQLLADEKDAANWNVAVSMAVLAGIAASDAACCTVLGRRSRGENHHDAERLLSEITPGGSDAAKALKRLIDLKDKGQYGMTFVSQDDLNSSIRQAQKLLDFADSRA